MRLRSFGLASLVVLGAGLVETSDALVRPKGADAPRVSADRAGRDHRALDYRQSGKLAAHGLAAWQAIFDADTGVPIRMWGSTAPIANATADATTAEAAARAFLANHLDLLAPGATLADLGLLANQLGPNGVRTVAFEQRAHGLRIANAAINFAFKRDRLIMVGSTALPQVAANVKLPQHALAPSALAARAQQWLAEDGHTVVPPASFATAPAERVIIPIIRSRTATGLDITYTVTDQLAVNATNSPGRWLVWLDSDTGAPVARASTISWVNSGTVNFDVPDQRPSGTRSPHPAPYATHLVNTVPTTATYEGVVTWPGTVTTATVVPQLSGSRVAIKNVAGSLVSDSLQLANGNSVTWSQASIPEADAQLDAYVYANVAKNFVKTKVNPNLAWLDGVVQVNVNENMTCNAYSTGDDIHFFKSDAQCENTGRLADVVYHESGHSIHFNSIIPGVGAFDGSLSEGLADSTAVSITGNPNLGVGFFVATPTMYLRKLDPTTPKRWPQDADGEVHDEGEIIGESLWDARQALIAKLGPDAGYAKALEIYYGVMQRSPDIPTSFSEVLVADDDDGDLTNGTPNMCALMGAFGKHGLVDPTFEFGLGTPTRDQFAVNVPVTQSPATACAGGVSVASASVDWHLRGNPDQTVALATDPAGYSGAIPTQPDGSVVEYRVQIKLSDGSVFSYPDNPADPYYQFYVGTPTVLWCSNFEAGAADWTHGASTARADEWEVGMPLGLGGDPKTAFDGTAVFGTDLTKDGIYKDNATTYAETSVDLKGNTANVHLQYERWLGVEDGFYDKATISANGETVWTNRASPPSPNDNTVTDGPEVNHVDKEWRFQDVDVSKQAAASTDGHLKLHFEIASDGGLGLGGWTLDNVCIVLDTAAPPQTGCDGGTCDGSGDGGGKASGGCCSSTTNPAGALSLGALALGLVFRRRRRRN